MTGLPQARTVKPARSRQKGPLLNADPLLSPLEGQKIPNERSLEETHPSRGHIL